MVHQKINREEEISLQPKDSNAFRIVSSKGKMLYDQSEDFYIYMKSVEFKPDGKMEGVYLGDNPDTLIDHNCQEATFSEEKGWMLPNGVYLKTARMVAVKNKSGVIVVIQSR